jgi:predicted transcriptional regulator
MPNLLEMASEIVSSHASNSKMTKEDLVKEIHDIHAVLSRLERGEDVATEAFPSEEEASAIPMRKAFGKKQVFCMMCGKGMKTLGRHIRAAHDMTPKEYRKKFSIPRTQTLAAKDYSEIRKQMAIDRGLGENLAKARAAKEKMK